MNEMMIDLIIFLVGMVTGGIIGFIVAALLTIGTIYDEKLEREFEANGKD